MKKKKSTKRVLTGRDPTSQLYRAVIRYIESKGGTVLVIGGAQIQQWPGEREFNYVLGVRCTGRKPKSQPDNGNERP